MLFQTLSPRPDPATSSSPLTARGRTLMWDQPKPPLRTTVDRLDLRPQGRDPYLEPPNILEDRRSSSRPSPPNTVRLSALRFLWRRWILTEMSSPSRMFPSPRGRLAEPVPRPPLSDVPSRPHVYRPRLPSGSTRVLSEMTRRAESTRYVGHISVCRRASANLDTDARITGCCAKVSEIES